MALSREVYQALEDIVGPSNISEEPAILDSYNWMHLNEFRTPDGSGFCISPEAALLPGSTEEVQAIVKACNRFGIRCKAFSTGWSVPATPLTEGVINLDLRRMNRIIEIDEKNMFAVVEPYVIAAQLQAEAMKLGLNAHLTGAGASCSPLASAICLAGYGPDTIFMGHGSEVLLGLEWVLPNGDILRTGSLGSGLGWFCGEGPGPSLRAIARGKSGAAGGLGIFTKCAVKLAPWPGPAVMPIEGTVPAYKSPLPENIRAYTLAFPSWQAYADACYKIYDAEIGYAAHRQFPKLGEDLSPAFYTMYNDPTKSLDDLEEILENPEVQKLTEELRRYSFQFVLAGMTPRDTEYQEKVLDHILAETGGHKVAAMSEPDMESFTLLYLLRLPSKNLNYVYAGGKAGAFAQHGIPDFVIKYAPVVTELMREHQEKGLLIKSGGDSMMGPISAIGGGGIIGLEEFCMYNRNDIESVRAAREFLGASAKTARELRLGPGLEATSQRVSKEEHQAMLTAAPQAARFHWQWKIKQMLDPNDIGDAKAYPMLEEPPKE